MNILQTYGALLELSGQMLDAAKAQQWETLGHLQARRAGLIAGLPPTLPPTPSAQVSAAREILLKIQALDAEVLEYVEPSREQIGSLISRLAPAR